MHVGPSQTVGCGSASEDADADVLQVIESLGEGSVVVVCSKASTSLDEELQQLLVLQEAVEAAEMPHIFFYTTSHAKQQRRSTMGVPMTEPLTGFGPYTSCGTLCQVRISEKTSSGSA